MEQCFRVAIVGFGPKGFYGFERLLAFLKTHDSLPVEINLFNRTPFYASGDVYRSDQETFLKMNYPDKNISAWPSRGPLPILNQTDNFVQWKKNLSLQSNCSGNTYSARALVGAYFEDIYKRLKKAAASTIEIKEHCEEVEDIFYEDDHYCIISNKNRYNHVHHILLTTGHQKVSRSKNLKKIQGIYPLKNKLSTVQPDSSVCIKGLGLTFIDAVLGLTEGRQGVFKREKNNTLEYHKSGREPAVIYAFSRSGYMMIPRRPNAHDHIIPYFSKSFLENEPKAVDFEEDFLPHVAMDFKYQYYRTLFQNYDENLEFSKDIQVIDNQIHEFHQSFPDEPLFDLHAMFEPLPAETKNWQKTITDQLERELKPLKDEKNSPWLQASLTWKAISPYFNSLYTDGGLTSKSQKVFDRYYSGLFNRISYGPPSEQMEKILVLLKNGLLNLNFAQSPQIKELPNGFKISRSGHSVISSIMIDARIPKIDMNTEKNKLYKKLCLNGLAKPYSNSNHQSIYFPGGIALNKYGQVINAKNTLQPGLYIYGTPTEGFNYDNDTLSRKRNNYASNWAQDCSKTYTKFLDL